jgi:hypothetical protein
VNQGGIFLSRHPTFGVRARRDLYYDRSSLQQEIVNMFKLLRLAIYAMVGYTVYQFITDVVHADAEASRAKSSGGGGGRGGRPRAAQPMTGAKRGGGAGKGETTQDADGGGTRHRVGRGVV